MHMAKCMCKFMHSQLLLHNEDVVKWELGLILDLRFSWLAGNNLISSKAAGRLAAFSSRPLFAKSERN